MSTVLKPFPGHLQSLSNITLRWRADVSVGDGTCARACVCACVYVYVCIGGKDSGWGGGSIAWRSG